MGNGTCVLLTGGISLLVLTSALRAENEQELAYHSEHQAQRIVGAVEMVRTYEEEACFTWRVHSLPWLILTNQRRIVKSNGFALA